MATFTTDHDELSITFELDAEPEVDLTRNQLGARILAQAVEELILCHQHTTAPDGTPWAELKPATVEAKHSRQVGTLTGEMLSPALWRSGRQTITRRSATYQYPHDGPGSRSWGKAHGFHNGAKGKRPRPLIGWTPEAQQFARQTLNAEVHR